VLFGGCGCYVGVVEARVCMLEMLPWVKSGVSARWFYRVDVSLVEMFRRLRRNAVGADRGTLAGHHVSWRPK